MLKIFYEVQSIFEKINFKLLKKFTYRVILELVRFIVPLYYKYFPANENGIIDCIEKQSNPKIIVTLTSFPPRMNTLWMVLESLLRQSKKPDRIILWLARSQFPYFDDIDTRIQKMESRGLEIRFCEDLRSHKKYYYAMQEFNNDIIITVDDDIFYPENMIAELYAKHIEYPESITCYRAHKITFMNGQVSKYVDWDHGARGYTDKDYLLMATGCGGVLYPPNCLYHEVFNIQAIQELCLNADDIWLKCMGILKGTKTVKVHGIYSEMFSTRGSSDSGLAKNNVTGGHNDEQLKKVLERYLIDFNRLNV
ncbi:glycosyltransferase [Paenibacillus luteus]|uniref:glycosyltransferase n=1 Tax=Paenibacillus luteus TaxID=2545753 RepID=UPI0011450583|nr:glycosyltransferase [Paenibacillus luteus]